MMRLLEILIFYFFLKIKNLSDLSEFRQANKTFQKFIIFFCYPFYI